MDRYFEEGILPDGGLGYSSARPQPEARESNLALLSLALRNDWPQTRAEVLFHDAGHKTIYLRYTRLEILDDWP